MVGTHHGLGMKHLTRILQRVLAHRRILATLAAMVCVFAVCQVASGQAGPTVQVCVAATRIGPGTTVTPDQVKMVAVPVELVPLGAITSTTQLPNRMTAAPVPLGAILTEDSFVSTSQAKPGSVIIPIAVSTQILPLLAPGQRIAVFSTTHTGEVTVTRGVRVVTIPAAGSSGVFSSGSSNIILVEVPEALAASIASTGDMGTVTVAIE